jgi:WD40 repeat protein
VFSLEFSADGERLFSGSNAGEAVKAWNVATRRETITLAGADQLFRMTRVSADGTVLGSVNRDGELHLWRAPSWAELEPLAKLSPQP